MPRAVHLALLRVYRRLPGWARLLVVRRVAPSFTVGAICVVERDDGRILLVRLSYRRRWGLPGGLLKGGEEAVDGARREVLEETGLAIDPVGEPTVVVAPGPRRVDVVYRARVAFGVDPDDARPVSPEIVDVRWVDPDALPELQHEAAGALRSLGPFSGRR